MKIICLILCAGIFSTTLNADGLAKNFDRVSILDNYRSLQDLFDSGTAPYSDSLVGLFSGRCFHVGDRPEAKNVMLYGWQETISGDNGPLFPPETTLLKALWGHRYGAPADFFDTLTSDVEYEINRLRQDYKKGLFATYEENDTLHSGFFGYNNIWPYRPISIHWYMRQSDDYIIMKEEQDEQIHAYCYLFKRLK